MQEKIKDNMNKRGENLTPAACPNTNSYRLKKELEDIRPAFFRDIDRIIHSLSYTRYIDKTQVFSFKENDNISKRMTHVQMVSKIARTIGRALNLNEDLIEASALGHDLGHVPFGHPGEYILSELSQKYNEGYFNHNVQSVRLLMDLENNGRGSNLTVQTLDAILCHNGEFVKQEYYPKNKTKEEFLEEYNKTYREKNYVKELIPMTLEGCVVRISDVIAYLGKDIEDAHRLGVFQKEDIPESITSILGDNNSDIINTIVLDIINNSIDQSYIKISDKIYEAICDLKEFNYQNIYDPAYTLEEKRQMKKMFEETFEILLKDLENNNMQSPIYSDFLQGMSEYYLNNTSNARFVIDYIAGMTDGYFIKIYKKLTGDYNKKEASIF